MLISLTVPHGCASEDVVGTSPIVEESVAGPTAAAAEPVPSPAKSPSASAPVQPQAPASGPIPFAGNGETTEHRSPDGSIITVTKFNGQIPDHLLQPHFPGKTIYCSLSLVFSQDLPYIWKSSGIGYRFAAGTCTDTDISLSTNKN